MRIAIIEDKEGCLTDLVEVLEEAGHEVLPIQVALSTVPASIVTGVTEFNPDVVLLDHDLDRRDMNGSDVARILGYGPDKIISISSAATGDFSYARDRFEWKEMIFGPKKRELLDMVAGN